MGRGYAFGKTILIGDQFVLNGVPAILSALPYKTDTYVTKLPGGNGFTVIDNRAEVPGYKRKKEEACNRSYEQMIKKMKLNLKKNHLKITVGGDLPAGSGIGASAAMCVSFARACNDEFKLGLDKTDENFIGWLGEHPYHGTPSGVDNTASSFGGIMLYMIRDEKKMYERIIPGKPLYVVLANCGITYNTSLLDRHVESLIKSDTEIFYTNLNKISEQVFSMKKAIEKGELKEVGNIMIKNHEILKQMDLSHEKLDELCKKTIDMGAYGAKLTGGGRGGYIVALVKDLSMQRNIMEKLKSENFPVIAAQLGINAEDNVKFRILK